MTARSRHARRGAVTGAVIGSVLGAVGGSLYETGCARDPCNATRQRVGLVALSAAEGAVLVGLLGGLVGWAWPASHR